MKRILNPVLVIAMLVATAQLPSHTLAQDVTITIKNRDQKNSKPIKGSKKASPFSGNRAAVDVAILLDTSNSMDGLINQAKSQLWNIVQQFAEAKKNGKTPLLRVSVFEYGNTNLPANEGYIRQVVQLTDDLDKVSEALFALSTNGGDEYCGMVINEAVKRLDWNGEPNAYKAIFIAGNEPFTQGSVDYQSACKKAIGAGIVINTIHCGNYQQGVSGKWQHGAQLAEGEFLNIDQDQKVVHIKAPQDKIIIELNNELNKTYLWFGKHDVRRKYQLNQSVQDSNAGSVGGISSRIQTKVGSLYRNVGRDLVDSYEADPESIEKIAVDELPEPMQKMNAQQRKQYVQEMLARRAEIKRKLAAASRERIAFVEAEEAKMPANPAAPTFGDAISTAVREQLSQSGFEVPGK